MLQQEKQYRRAKADKDPSYRYATDNLSIDDFMDGKSPNLYGISLNDVYARGVNAGKAASARNVSANDAGSIVGNYFRDFV